MWQLFSYAFGFGWLLSIRLLLWSIFPFIVHKVPRTKGSGFWIPVIQVAASFILLVSLVVEMSSLCLSFIFCYNLQSQLSSSLVLLQYELSIALFSSSVIVYLFLCRYQIIIWNLERGIGCGHATYGEVIFLFAAFSDLFMLTYWKEEQLIV